MNFIGLNFVNFSKVSILVGRLENERIPINETKGVYTNGSHWFLMFRNKIGTYMIQFLSIYIVVKLKKEILKKFIQNHT